MIIAPMQFKDLAAVYQIEQEAFAHPWSIDNFANELQDCENCFLYVCYQEDQLIGYYGFHLLFDEFDITKLAIKKQFRQQGIAKLLLADLILRAAQNKIKKIYLEVNVNNIAAINLYHQFQFSQIGIRKNYYRDGSDALVLARRLDYDISY